MKAFLWVHPIVYLFEKYIKEVHEQHADQQTLQSCDYQSYKEALKYSAYAAIGISHINAFNQSKITKRLRNMKYNNRNSSKWIYSLIIPITVALSIAMNARHDIGVNQLFDLKENVEDANLESVKLHAVADTIPNKNKVYQEVDEKPRYTGCEDQNLNKEELNKCASRKLLMDLYTNIKYPDAAKENGVEGTVIVKFTVTKEGDIANPVIMRNIGDGCGQEVLRVVKSMNKKWVPGRLQGEAVNVEYTLPVKFKLSSDDDSENSEEEVFKIVEEKPRFPGCEEMLGTQDEKMACSMKKMLEFLYTNIKYPEKAMNDGNEGSCVVSFIVEKDGSLSDIKVVRSVSPEIDEESRRVVELMMTAAGKWNPGKQDGKVVRTQYNLPIKYQLDSEEKSSSEVEPQKTNVNDDQVFRIADQRPRFPGCENINGTEEEKIKCSMTKMIDFLYTNVKYPEKAKKDGKEGTVVVAFVVEKDGTFSDIKMVRGISTEIDEEAIRVAKLMETSAGKWTPGKQNDQVVRVQYNLPIKFKLTSDEKSSSEEERSPHKTYENESAVFKIVEDRPRFPGCEDSGMSKKERENCAREKMLHYIYENVTYPAGAKKSSDQGTVVVSFIVEKDGSLTGIKIVRSVSTEIDAEAMRVVHSMNNLPNKWSPGKQRGLAVRVQYNLPIKFQLEDKVER